MNEVRDATTDRRIVEMRTRGYSPKAIANALGMTTGQVVDRIRALALEIRAGSRELVANRWLEHERALNHLRAVCQGWVNRMTEWDATRITALVKVLERHAKLLGLDVDPRTAADNDSWLDDKAPAQLVELAKQLNIPLPPDLQVPECSPRPSTPPPTSR